ncbi:DUF222 domain-containing protein [Naasia sp. SYSU D00057]|uniref:DUF222 domain-containing protein n=1 Tax=Naasia sp. SYSU D00057 TaxID=2817380 RepID=UPI001B3024C3|nr:DUF222 domain-containing protein [Naasia sp. SYSU D00057]
MASPTATLADEAIGLDRALVEAAVSGDAGQLRELLDGLGDTALIELVRSSGRLANLADAIGSAAAGEFAGRSTRGDEESLAKRLGERSAPLAVAALGRVSVRRAVEWVAVGQALGVRRSLVGERLPDAHPEVAAALDSGAIGAEAADLIVDTLKTIAPKRDADQLAGDEAFLVQSALVQTTQGLGRICKSYIAHADPDGVAAREADLVAKAGTKVIQRRSGMVAILTEADPESAGYLLTAINARTAPKREVRFRTDEEEQDDAVLGDDRSLARRRLDALVSIARDAIKRDDGVVGGISAKVIVTIDHEALLTGIGSATIAGVDQPISAAAARRIACDALILPAVLGGKSQVLDFGEGRRLHSENQRLALVAQYGGCGWGTCLEPPGRCEAAHVKGWHQGIGNARGPTAVANGILLCAYHHRRFDNDGWELQYLDGVPHLIPPPWVDPLRSPRRCRTALPPA